MGFHTVLTRHLGYLGLQGDAPGCFCPPGKLLNQVGPSSWCKG